MKKKFYHKTKVVLSQVSLTIPNQTTPLRILLAKFAAGLPIGDGSKMLDTYEFDISDCFDGDKENPKKTLAKIDEFEQRGTHHADEIDIVVTQDRVSRAKSDAVREMMKKTSEHLSKSELKKKINFEKAILKSVTKTE